MLRPVVIERSMTQSFNVMVGSSNLACITLTSYFGTPSYPNKDGISMSIHFVQYFLQFDGLVAPAESWIWEVIRKPRRMWQWWLLLLWPNYWVRVSLIMAIHGEKFTRSYPIEFRTYYYMNYYYSWLNSCARYPHYRDLRWPRCALNYFTTIRVGSVILTCYWNWCAAKRVNIFTWFPPYLIPLCGNCSAGRITTFWFIWQFVKKFCVWRYSLHSCYSSFELEELSTKWNGSSQNQRHNGNQIWAFQINMR